MCSLFNSDGYSSKVSSLALVTVNFTEGSVIMSNFTSFLPSAMLVMGAIVVSVGECRVHRAISFNTTLRRTSTSECIVCFILIY